MYLLFRKEVLSIFYTPRFVLIILIFLLMSVVITFSQSLEYQQNLIAINNVADNIDYNKQVTWIFPMSIHVMGARSFLASPVGVSFLGDLYYDKILEKAENDSLFQAIDLQWLYKVMISLCALFLSYGMICGEKEKGTLKQVLSYGVKRAKVVLAKAFAVVFVLAVSILISYLFSILLASFITSTPFDSGYILQLAFYFLLTLIYAVLFVFLGVTISTFSVNQNTALLVALSGWILLVFALPAAVSGMLSNSSWYQTEKALLMKTISEREEQFHKKNEELELSLNVRKWYKVIWPDLLKLRGREYLQYYNKIANRYEGVKEEFWFWSMFVPVLGYDMAAVEISGTGASAELLKKRESVVFHRLIHEEGDPMGGMGDPVIVLSKESGFHFSQLLKGMLQMSFSLFLAGVFILLSVFRFNRYDVR